MVDLIVFSKVVALIVTILIIWFNSGAFAAYCKVFGLKKILFGYDKNTDSITFPQYLYIKRNIIFTTPISLFIIELITCPLCLSVWLSIFGAGIFLNLLYAPIVFLASLLIYTFFARLLN